MPGQLFTDAERRRLGGFPAQVSPEDLATFYTLTRSDRAAVNQCADDAGRLGFALQLGTLRYLGFCPDDLVATPGEIVRFLADQLKVPPEGLPAYGRRGRLAPITSSPSRTIWDTARPAPKSGRGWPAGYSTGPWSTTAPCCSGNWPARSSPPRKSCGPGSPSWSGWSSPPVAAPAARR